MIKKTQESISIDCRLVEETNGEALKAVPKLRTGPKLAEVLQHYQVVQKSV